MLIRMNYLSRKKTGIYEFRRRVPSELIDLLGKQEIKASLKTRSESEALRLVQRHNTKFELDMQRAYQRLESGETAAITFHQAEILSQKWLDKLCKQLDSNGSKEGYIAWLVKVNGEFETLQGFDVLLPDTITERTKRKLDPYIDDVLERESLSYSKDSASYNELRYAFNRAAQQLSMYCYNRLNHREASVTTPLADKPSLRDANQTKLSAVAAGYLRERELFGGLAKNTITEFNSGLKDFVDLFGDVDINEIGRNDVRYYRDLLLQQPSSKLKVIRNMPLVDRIDYAKREELPIISKATVGRKLKLLSPMFTYAIEAGHIEQNPFEKQTAKLRSSGRSIEKKTYTESDLKIIFSQPIFTTSIPEKIHKRFAEAAYWVPLVLYYTGARREEICQLHGANVQQVEGIWCFKIFESEPDQKLKNDESIRIVPIHPDLIELGFIDYCTQMDGLLFPKLKSKSGDHGNNIGKWFGTFVRGLGIEIKQPVHGLRHTFKTLCRSAEIPEGAQYWLSGHSPNDVGAAYGEYRIDLLYKYIAKFPSVPSFENLRTRKKQFPTGVAV